MLGRLFVGVLALLWAGAAMAGTLERGSIDSRALKGNAAGLASTRNVTVYLPDGYAGSKRRLPVLYYLSSFFEDDRAPYADHDALALFDRAITAGQIGPVIVVTADFTTPAGSSWYVNSPVTGNWDDFMVRELVRWVDARYRTLAGPQSRGVAGDRAGGHGAIRFGMRHPEIFGAVYALHPIGTGPGLQSMLARPNWQLLQTARSIDDLRQDGFSLIFASIFQAHLPDIENPPLFFEAPARLRDGRMEIDARLNEMLHQRFFLERQVGPHAANLRKLRGLMFD